MSAKDRAINKSLNIRELRAKVQNGTANRIEIERVNQINSLSASVPANINDLWEWANDKLKYLIPDHPISEPLEGEHDSIIRELFEARREAYLAQLELFELWDQPVKAQTRINEISSKFVEAYLTIDRLRNTKD